MKMVENRKELVKRLTQLTETKAEYTRMPRCAFLVGDYAVERDGTLTVPDDADMEPVEALLTEGLIREYDPEAEARVAEAAELERAAVEREAKRPKPVEVSFPLDVHTAGSLRNLAAMLVSRGSLISKATGGRFSCTADFLERISGITSPQEFRDILLEQGGLEGFEVTDDSVCFTGFPETSGEKKRMAFTQLATLMNRLALEQKHTLARPVDESNERYIFRIWLLRLGMVGDEYKETRKLLLAPLSGNMAFRTPENEAKFRARQKEKRRSL